MMENLTVPLIMHQYLTVSDLNNNSLNNFNTSVFYPNGSNANETEIGSSGFLSDNEVARLLQVFIRPILIILGTYGNAVSFFIMRRGSLKEVSTCFYMAILAIADTREYIYSVTLCEEDV